MNILAGTLSIAEGPSPDLELAAAAPELLRLIRQGQWASIFIGKDDDEVETVCPWCASSDFLGHAPDCPANAILKRFADK